MTSIVRLGVLLVDAQRVDPGGVVDRRELEAPHRAAFRVLTMQEPHVDLDVAPGDLASGMRMLGSERLSRLAGSLLMPLWTIVSAIRRGVLGAGTAAAEPGLPAPLERAPPVAAALP